jgi:hypothetical protein
MGGGQAVADRRAVIHYIHRAATSESGHVPSTEDVNGFGVGDELYSRGFGLNSPAAAAPSNSSLPGCSASPVSPPLCTVAAPKPEAEIAIDPRSRVHFTLS